MSPPAGWPWVSPAKMQTLSCQLSYIKRANSPVTLGIWPHFPRPRPQWSLLRGERLRFFAPHHKVEPDRAKVFCSHFCQHLLICLGDLLLGHHPCRHQEWLREPVGMREVLGDFCMGIHAGRKIDGTRRLLNIYKPGLLQKLAQQGGDAKADSIGRETLLGQEERACDHAGELLKCAAIGDRQIALGQPHGATASGDPQALAQERWPGFPGHKARHEAHIHQVKGVIRKVKWLERM